MRDTAFHLSTANLLTKGGNQLEGGMHGRAERYHRYYRLAYSSLRVSAVWAKCALHHDHIACCALRSTQTIPGRQAFVHLLPSMPPSSHPWTTPSEPKTCKCSIVVVMTKEDENPCSVILAFSASLSGCLIH
ncbi:hypothetical protein ElyMa_001589200 [Elysia marginata]|uniref:Uncharacterized protein n=1 Tax=Elysia marginata TaxID=1093978 RepID=A0AAV4JH54_9GAST|nr:hypothetical protein ElyMa_001589200 [Elysia marginata]